jgi:hypothetical protein
MKIEFKKLFSIDLSSDFYADNGAFGDILIEPTNSCLTLLKKYRLDFRNSQRGAFLFYEGREKTPPTISPLIEIKQEVTFIFRLKIENPAFFDYAQATDWMGGKVYFFKNTIYNTTGDIAVNADLTNPLLNRPAKFKFLVELQNSDSMVQITDGLGGFIQNIIIPKKQSALPKEEFAVDIDLSQKPDGAYTIKHLGTSNELKCYKSNHFEPQTFAYLHITYQNGAWTTSATPQVFKLNFKVKSLVWKYEIHQWEGKPPIAVIVPSDVKIEDKSAVPIAFSVEGAVAFPLIIKSNSPIEFKNTPRRIQLLKNPNKTLIDLLPNPTTNNLQKTSGGIIALMKITI